MSRKSGKILRCYIPTPDKLMKTRLIEIKKSDPMYKHVCLNYLSSIQKLSLKKIEKVYCPSLYERYKSKKANREKRGYKNFEKRLMYVTDVRNIEAIMRSSLKWRRMHCYKLKTGVSFSENAEYADKNVTWNVGKNRAMIIADVLVGKADVGGYCTELPLNGGDVTPENRRVYVKFYGDEFIPRFIVYYTYNEIKI
nr:uncharacterized protein LOC111413521 [Onthophagus taurus]